MIRPLSNDLEAIGRVVVDCCFKVHSTLGPGLLESVYESCLCFELRKRGLLVERQVSLPVVYDSLTISDGFRLDLVVQNRIIIELKAVEALLPVHESQLITYLKLSKCRLGYLVNFNVALIKDGIKRRVV